MALIGGSSSLSSSLCSYANNSAHALAARDQAKLSISGGTFSDNSAALSSSLPLTPSGASALTGAPGLSSRRLAVTAASHRPMLHASMTKFFRLNFARPERSALLTAAVANLSVASVSAGDGGGVAVFDQSLLAMSSVTLTRNKAARGAGVFLDDSTIGTVTGCNFTANAASSAGGGLCAAGNSTLSLSDCSFTSNTAGMAGAGIALLDGSSGTLSSSSFQENSSPGSGAAVFIQRENSSAAGVVDNSRGVLACTNLTFDGTRAPESQASAYFDASYLPDDRTKCSFCSNVTRNDSIGTLPTSFVLS